MNGDFTRSTFRPEKHFSSVRMQQGRVQLDADWNEQVDIQSYLDQTTRHDVIGACGVPKEHGGFQTGITDDGTDLTISPGRIYVDGVLCEHQATGIPATHVLTQSVELEMLVADGQEFRLHEWVEIADEASDTGARRLARVTAVNAEARTLTFSPPLDATTVSELGSAGAKPIVRRVVTYTTQPDLPNPDLVTPGDSKTPPVLGLADGTHLVYLDVWQRHLTALDDRHIRETALGGPDTTTRMKSVWQLRLKYLQAGALEDCAKVPGWGTLFNGTSDPGDRPASTGRVQARATPESEASDVCEIPPGAGYRRLENQLYRVEIHQPGELGTATFKWSRENGSVVTLWTAQDGNRLEVSSVGRDGFLGFASGQLVELTDDGRELKGQPGTLVSLVAPPSDHTLTIDPAAIVSRADFPGNPKIRRWDSTSELTVEVPASAEGWISLEDGVEIKFEAGYFNTGDYWLIPARTPAGDVEWPRDSEFRPLPRQPDGIRHHYCQLALVHVTGGVPVNVIDCREIFPSLTGTCAEDICFDNSACQLVDVETVQDALDALCEEHTLRRHKKHLHGWGIVCGLQVVCGPDGVAEEPPGRSAEPPRETPRPSGPVLAEPPREAPDFPAPAPEPAPEALALATPSLGSRAAEDNGGGSSNGNGRAHVTVRQGYAIDCEGNDILLEEDETLDILRMIAEQEKREAAEDGSHEGRGRKPLLDDGNGEVCLRLDLDAELRPSFALERYDPKADSLESIFTGTLLYDFYEDCVRKIHEFLKEELTPKKGEEDLPASPGFQRQAVLSNLLAEIVNPQPGKNIYISAREHDILHEFYTKLRSLLQSETFCAMFDSARPFPEYSESFPEMDTIFGRNHHVRLRLRPSKEAAIEAYSVGPSLNPLKPSTRINRYDLAERVLVSQIDPIAGASTGDTDSGIAAVEDIAFSPDGKRIYMVAPTRNEENTFFRVGVIQENDIKWGSMTTICGVKLITLATTNADPKGVYAIGLGKGLYRIDPDAPDPNMEPLHTFTASGHLEIAPDGQFFATAAASGQLPPVYDQLVYGAVDKDTFSSYEVPEGVDGIALALNAEGVKQDSLYCVVGLDGSNNKEVLRFTLFPGEIDVEGQVPVEDTTIRLNAFGPTGALLLTYEDGYCVRMIDMASDELVEDYVLPVQVGPIAIASDAHTAYVLNHVSDTITVAPQDVLRPDFRFPLEDLASYRKGILEAFADLLAGFLQYLKDCLCDHFLVDCPECTGDERLYLGCVSIREGQVYKVCNFSKRKYVKSFPTVGYWLSIVPLMPLLDRFIEQFCCMVLPELFGRYEAAPYEAGQAGKASPRVRAASVREGTTRAQAIDAPARLREFFTEAKTAGMVGAQAIAQGLPLAPSRAAAAPAEIIGKPVDKAAAVLAERGIDTVLQPYAPATAPSVIEAVAAVFRRPKPGSEVTLHEEAGRVRQYSVAAPAPTRALETRLRRLTRSVEERDTEIQLLRGQVERLEAREKEAPEAVSATKFAELAAELEDLRAFRAQVQEFMTAGPKRPAARQVPKRASPRTPKRAAPRKRRKT